MTDQQTNNQEVVDTTAAQETREETVVTALEPIAQTEPLVVEEAPTEAEAPHIPAPKHGFRHFCYRFVKRAFDIVSAGSLFLLASPVIVLLLLIKYLEDFKNPVYVSRRVGKGGREFRFYKIRTMKVGAEAEKAMLEQQGLNEMDGPVFKIKNDPRITKVGRIYRKFSLDELLQLINIINGTMSVVGPRPPIPKEVAEYEEWQKHRLDVKGGLLCLWQVQPNRNDLTFDEWVKLDLAYIEKQSLWLDFKIICKGAYMVIFDHSGT